MNQHRTFVVLAAATLFACRAGGTPQAAAAEKPTPAGTQAPAPATAAPGPAPTAAPPKKIADPRTEALVGWLQDFFPWGPGELTVEPLEVVRIPGWRLYRASKAFTGDKRADDQAFVLADDTGKTALVGDVFVDQARLKVPRPVRDEGDLDSLHELVAQYLRGRFKISLEPSLDRRSFKGVRIQHDTGYGPYTIEGFVSSWDGALLLIGRAWDRGRSFAEQRRALFKLDGAPTRGPADATVTVVEYSDMQCPFCKKRAADFDVLVAKLGKELKIRRVSKAFPITDHTWAFRAASAGYCFFDANKDLYQSWKSSVFSRQEMLDVASLDTFALDFAVANNIPEQAFRSCYLQGSSVSRVLADLSEGFAVRVRSTPTYFVDGVPLSWFSDGLMEEYLRKTYLKGAGLPAASPAPARAPAAKKK